MIIVNKVNTPPKEKVLELFSTIIDSGVLTNNGPMVKRFEDALRKYTGAKHGLTVTNGTIAIQIAIKALQLKGEVVTTPFTFVASSSALVWENCKPVFADIDPDTLCLDPKSAESKISTKTTGILPVHIYGNLCEINEIENLAKQYNLKTIYDGAQAFGSKYNGESAMNFGDITTLSLHAYKILNSIEGGAIFSKSAQVNDEVFKIRYFGKELNNEVVQVGINGKMNEISAAYGLVSLETVSSEIEERKKIYNLYKTELSSISGLRFQKIKKEVEINYAYFPIIFPNEATLLRTIANANQKGVEIRRYFYPILSTMEFFNSKIEDTPIAFDLSKRIACLPIYSGLTASEFERIVTVIKENI